MRKSYGTDRVWEIPEIGGSSRCQLAQRINNSFLLVPGPTNSWPSDLYCRDLTAAPTKLSSVLRWSHLLRPNVQPLLHVKTTIICRDPPPACLFLLVQNQIRILEGASISVRLSKGGKTRSTIGLTRFKWAFSPIPSQHIFSYGSFSLSRSATGTGCTGWRRASSSTTRWFFPDCTIIQQLGHRFLPRDGWRNPEFHSCFS